LSCAVYLHVPFCARRCDYCDFYSTVDRADESHCRYLEAVLRELSYRLSIAEWPRPITSFYIGGGTPSLVRAELYAPLFAALARFGMSPEVEITVEANPESLTPAWLAAMRDYGVNRLSLGVQTWQERLLPRLGRLHDAEESRRAVALAREQGITNLSLDFIFGIPEQTGEDLAADLRELTAWQPEHVSWYCLTWEQGTALYERWQRRPQLKAGSDLEADRFLLIHRRLEEAGYEHYEVSNYARPGFRSRHNQSYWRRQPYLGLGAAAASFDGVSRWANPRDLEAWREALAAGRDPAVEQETVTGVSLRLETLYLGLRRLDGVTERELRQVLGEREYLAILKKMETSRYGEYIQRSDGRIRLTTAGILLLDAIILELAGDHE